MISSLASSSVFAQVNKTWIGASGNDWFNPSNWAPAGVPATNDNVNVTNYSTINLTAPVAIYGQFNFRAGNLTGSPLTIGSNGVMNIGGYLSLYLPLTNQGTVNWQSGEVDLYNNGSSSLGAIWNQPGGLWSIQCDQPLRGLLSHEQFQNAGLVRKSAGAGATPLGVPLVNSGTVSVWQGTLGLDGGFTNLAGTLNCGLSGTSSFGQIAFSGNAALGGTFTADLLNGFVPAISNSFAVVAYFSSGGVFTNVQLPAAATWQTNYGPAAFTITVVSISKLAILSTPSGTNAGAVLAPLVAQVEDVNGNPIAANGVAVTVSLGSGSGTLSGTLTQITDTNGMATFNDLSLNLAGPKTLQVSASAAGLSPASTGPFTITASAPSQLALTSPTSSPQPDGYVFSPATVVRVTDAFGNAISNSTATITARLGSGGGGALAGTTNVNANGSNGSASFGSLRYRLGNSNVAESIVIYFTSPGLSPVTNPAVAVRPVLLSITLQDRNSVVQVDPTTERGIFSWTVDGVGQLFQHWFWLHRPVDDAQNSVDHLGAAFRDALSSSNAVWSYLTPSLSLRISFTLQGGAPGSQTSALVETVTLNNLSSVTQYLDLFDYGDFDLAGSWTNDTVSFPTPRSAVQQGKGMTLTQSVAPTPDYWEASFYAITLDNLDGPGGVNLSDSFIPQAPGDQTFAFQWYFALGAGQGLVLSVTNNLHTVSLVQPVALSIARTGENILLSWPTNGSTGFQLQSLSLFSENTNWQAVTNLPVVIGQQYQVTLPQISTGKLYRLQR